MSRSDIQKTCIEPNIFEAGRWEPPAGRQAQTFLRLLDSVHKSPLRAVRRGIVGFREALARPDVPSARIALGRMTQAVDRKALRVELLTDSDFQ